MSSQSTDSQAKSQQQPVGDTEQEVMQVINTLKPYKGVLTAIATGQKPQVEGELLEGILRTACVIALACVVGVDNQNHQQPDPAPKAIDDAPELLN